LSFELSAVFDSVTSNVPTAPDGIDIPLVAGIDCESSPVNLSPTALVFVHTFELDVKVSKVPAATVPVTGTMGFGAGAGSATGAGVGAGVGLGAGLGAGRRGRGAGSTGLGAGAGAATGAGGGVTGTSFNLGCTVVSRAAMAKSRPSVVSAVKAVSLAFLSPHAVELSATALSRTSIAREGRIYSRIRKLLDEVVQRMSAFQALKRLLPYYHPYRRQVAVGLTVTVVAAAASSIIPTLLEHGLDAMEPGGDLSRLRWIVSVMLITAVGSGLLRFMMRSLLNGISRRIETDLRHDLLERLLTLDPAWYGRWRTGDLMARLTNDLSAVRMAAGPAVMYFTNTIFGGLFALFMMLRINPTLTGVALLPMIGLPVIMIKLGREVHRRFEAVQSQFSNMSTRAQENLAGVRVVRAYRQEASEFNRFDTMGATYLDANMGLAKLNGIMNPSFGLLAGFGGAVTLGVGGHLLIAGTITVGGFVAFGIYLAMLTWPLIALGWTTNLFQRGAASMSRVLDLLDALPAVVTDVGSATLNQTGKGHSIEFQNVWFHYPAALATTEDGAAKNARYGDTSANAEPLWVLKDVSFKVDEGDTLAIVGATGSGKSALMDLIPRLFDPQRGVILIDGIPIRTLSLQSLRGEIGYVPQESLLFSETIGANVSYGMSNDVAPLTHMSDMTVAGGDSTLPEVLEATSVAQLEETVAALPDKFGTRLGERGINLSGGQKQRTALARALARRPRIVLLDDALSAVDTQTEAAILHGLQHTLRGRTAVIASHRISAVRDADWILVLADGAVTEQGRHDELVARNGRYAALLRRQRLLESIEKGEENAA
jgi:ATP-binding cassette subfamily B multidrug efflux pump